MQRGRRGPFTDEQFNKMRNYSIRIGIPADFFDTSIFKVLKIVFDKSVGLTLLGEFKEITPESEEEFVYLLEERMIEAKKRNIARRPEMFEKFKRSHTLIKSINEFYDLPSEQRIKLFKNVYNHMLSIPKKGLNYKL